MEIARKQKIPIVYASSSAIYGNMNKGNDDINEFDIISPYALDKFVLENLQIYIVKFIIFHQLV